VEAFLTSASSPYLAHTQRRERSAIAGDLIAAFDSYVGGSVGIAVLGVLVGLAWRDRGR
jgi:hypothetical protein